MDLKAQDPNYARKVAESFAKQSMMATFGAELTKVAPGEVEITAPILPGARQQHGFAHAALTFAIGDSAAGYAALSILPQEMEVLTAETKINLLAPAKGERLIARGRVIKQGRRLLVVQAAVYALQDGTETQVALMQGTMVPVPREDRG